MTILIWLITAFTSGQVVATTTGSAEFASGPACMAARATMKAGSYVATPGKPDPKSYEVIWAECLSKQTGAIFPATK